MAGDVGRWVRLLTGKLSTKPEHNCATGSRRPQTMPTAAEAAQRTISETERLIAEMFKLPEGQRRAFMNRERIPLASIVAYQGKVGVKTATSTSEIERRAAKLKEEEEQERTKERAATVTVARDPSPFQLGSMATPKTELTTVNPQASAGPFVLATLPRPQATITPVTAQLKAGAKVHRYSLVQWKTSVVVYDEDSRKRAQGLQWENTVSGRAAAMAWKEQVESKPDGQRVVRVTLKNWD
jgi:hypothetical protein